jgi:hypothetical protein
VHVVSQSVTLFSSKHVLFAVDQFGFGAFQWTILSAVFLAWTAAAEEIISLTFLTVVLQGLWHFERGRNGLHLNFRLDWRSTGMRHIDTSSGPLRTQAALSGVFRLNCSLWFLSAIADNYAVLVAFRAIVGFGFGGLTVPTNPEGKTVVGLSWQFGQYFVIVYA